MPKFCANLTMLFNEFDFLDRFKEASKAGFEGVEYLFPYAYDKEVLADLLRSHNLVQVLHNLPAGDWEAGERGIACHPVRIAEFKQGVQQAIEYATTLDCKLINVLAGIVPDGLDLKVAEQTFIANIDYAATELKKHDIKLLVEAINTRDIPNFLVSSTEQAKRLIDASGNDNISLQYDVYHMQIMEGDLVPTIKSNIEQIAHVQIADNPGRHEPGTGEIHYPFIFSQLDEIGYTGWIGCEYKPKTETIAGLDWMN